MYVYMMIIMTIHTRSLSLSPPPLSPSFPSQGRSHVFEMGDGSSIGYGPGSSHTLSAGSPGSGTSFPAMGMPLYAYDGSMSSSQSISSSNSEKQSEDIEDMEQLDK